jgi:hypothetical protein
METCGTPFTPFCGGSSLLVHTPAGYGGDLDSLRVGFGCDTKKVTSAMVYQLALCELAPPKFPNETSSSISTMTFMDLGRETLEMSRVAG